jgi:hypothetical protein
VALSAQQPGEAPITVAGAAVPDASQLTPGPEIKGFISARKGDRFQVTAADGSKSVITMDNATVIKASKGLFGNNKLDWLLAQRFAGHGQDDAMVRRPVGQADQPAQWRPENGQHDPSRHRPAL